MVQKNDIKTDVLIIGQGIAGAIAAARAKELTDKVSLVSLDNSATSMSSGAMDFASNNINIAHRDEPILTVMNKLARESKHHPYNLFDDNIEKYFNESINLTKTLLQNLNLVIRDDGYNHILATDFGTIKKTALVQTSSLMDIAYLNNANIAVVGFNGLNHFDPTNIAKILQYSIGLNHSIKCSVTGVKIDLKSSSNNTWHNNYYAAIDLDSPGMQQKLIKNLKKALEDMPTKFSHLLFPAVLGFDSTDTLHKKLQEELQCDIAEMLSTYDSVPGLRLKKAIEEGLLKKNIDLIKGKVKNNPLVRDKMVKQISVVNDNNIINIHPKSIVLASGKFFAQGAVSDNHLNEQIFSLPLYCDNEDVSQTFSGDLLNNNSYDKHKLFRCGLAYDKKLNIKTSHQKLYAKNFFAAGSVLQGFDPIKDKSSMGVSIMTGYFAGEMAAKYSLATND